MILRSQTAHQEDCDSSTIKGHGYVTSGVFDGGTGVSVGWGVLDGIRVGRRVGVFVGTGVFVFTYVDITRGVLVGVLTNVGVLIGVRVATRVGVRVATFVCVGTRVGVLLCKLRIGSVAVPISVRVGTMVNVTLAVKVGVAEMRGVAVGVKEGVVVGLVEVGNGPSSDCAVPAKEVLIASRFDPELPSPNTLELPNVIASAAMMNPRNKIACRLGCNEAFFCLFTRVDIL